GDHVRPGLGDADRDGAEIAHRGALHADACPRIHGPQGHDELCQIFDRIDVVMRRGRDERYAGARPADGGDLRRHLFRRKLAAFAGLGALADLDLDFVGVDDVRRVDAEAPAGHLADPRTAIFPLPAAIAARVFAAFAAVRLAAEVVERRRDGAVRGP